MKTLFTIFVYVDLGIAVGDAIIGHYGWCLFALVAAYACNYVVLSIEQDDNKNG